MNHTTTARLYMLFALILLFMGWKVCENASAQIQKIEDQQIAQLDRLLEITD